MKAALFKKKEVLKIEVSFYLAIFCESIRELKHLSLKCCLEAS